MSKLSLINVLALDGLIHLWGAAGSGKTLFASLVAAEVSRQSKVEWINTDLKQSFVQYLKRNIDSVDGSIRNVSITMAQDRDEVLRLILGLSEFLPSDVSLVVIDSITRVLDMSREDPVLWGKELIEDALPTLAGLVNERGIMVIITSESRAMGESGNLAIHHRTIKKWVDHDFLLVRHALDDHTRIMKVIDTPEDSEEIGILRLMDDGIHVVQPRYYKSTSQVGGQC